MALAINITDGHGLSNEMHRELLPKKGKIMLFAIHFIVKAFLISCTLPTRQSVSILKVGIPCELGRLYKKTGL